MARGYYGSVAVFFDPSIADHFVTGMAVVPHDEGVSAGNELKRFSSEFLRTRVQIDSGARIRTVSFQPVEVRSVVVSQQFRAQLFSHSGTGQKHPAQDQSSHEKSSVSNGEHPARQISQPQVF